LQKKISEMNRIRKILVITERFYPESFLINDLVTEWSGKDVEVTVLTQAPSYPMDAIYPGYRNNLVSVQRYGRVRVFRFFTVLGYKNNVILKMLNYLSFVVCALFLGIPLGLSADAVFVYHTGPLTLAIPAACIKLISPGKRTVIWTQDIWPDTVFAYGFSSEGLFSHLLKSLVRFIYRGFDSIIVSSEGFVERVRQYARKATPIHHIPQWAPPEIYEGSCSDIEMDSSTFNFCFAGTIGTMQNLDMLIDAFGRASSKDSYIRLHLIGDGSGRARLESRVRQNAYPGIVFHGQKPIKEVLPWLKASDALILPLTSDPVVSLTLPAKTQAYLVARKPILAIARGAVENLVLRYNLGLAASPDDENDIEGKILAMSSWVEADGGKVQENAAYLLDNLFCKRKSVDALFKACVDG